MAPPPAQSNPLSIRDVLATSFEVFRAHFGVFLTGAVVIVLLPLFALQMLMPGAAALEPEPPASSILSALSFMVGATMTLLSIGVVDQSLRGGNWRFGAVMKHYFDVLPRLIAVQLLTGIAIIAGLFVFILPGLYLAMRLIVAVPHIVIERGSVTGALRESWSLTKDAQWSLAGLLLIWVGLALLFLVALALTIAPFLPEDADAMSAPLLILQHLTTGLFLGFAYVLQAIAYIRLRQWHDRVSSVGS